MFPVNFFNRKTLIASLLAASMVSIPVSASVTLDPQTKASIDDMVAKSYQVMQTRYSDFAVLFNLCQKMPNDHRCGPEYNEAQSRYHQAKSIYDVLNVLVKEDMLDVQLPAGGKHDLYYMLEMLGYIDVTGDREADLRKGLNHWCQDKGIAESDELYLAHLMMAQTDLAYLTEGLSDESAKRY